MMNMNAKNLSGDCKMIAGNFWYSTHLSKESIAKLDQVNSANLLFELCSLVFYVLICYRICRAEQLSRGTIVVRDIVARDLVARDIDI